MKILIQHKCDRNDVSRMLQENYRTLINNLEITKKVLMEEMNEGKHLAMNKDKLLYDIEHASKQGEYNSS